MKKTVIGRIDRIDLPEFGLENIAVKIDTGANRSSIHCTKIEYKEVNGKEYIRFNIPLHDNDEDLMFSSADFIQKKVKSSFGQVENRFIVKTAVILFGKRFDTSFSLSDRTGMKFPVLLGRKLLASQFIVDVDLKDLSYQQKNTIF